MYWEPGSVVIPPGRHETVLLQFSPRETGKLLVASSLGTWFGVSDEVHVCLLAVNSTKSSPLGAAGRKAVASMRRMPVLLSVAATIMALSVAPAIAQLHPGCANYAEHVVPVFRKAVHRS